jgi:hypothetical protein
MRALHFVMSDDLWGSCRYLKVDLEFDYTKKTKKHATLKHSLRRHARRSFCRHDIEANLIYLLCDASPSLVGSLSIHRHGRP